MSRKTNKTSHVMNLITNGGPETEVVQDGTPKESVSAPEPQKPAPENKVIVVNETSENEKLSNEIKNRLEAQLEAEVAEAQAAGQVSGFDAEMADLEPADAKEPEQPDAAPVQKQPSAMPEAESQTAPAQPAPAQPPVKMQPVSQDNVGFREVPAEPQYRMLNVMERILGNMDLQSEMKQYGVCLCSRCRADVQALVLTNLPAKYVIVDATATSPIIGYYEGSYRTQIFTEIAKACMKVKDHPRH